MLLPRISFSIGRPRVFRVGGRLRPREDNCCRAATDKAYYIMALSLDRDMTHPAMTEYLESQYIYVRQSEPQSCNSQFV